MKVYAVMYHIFWESGDLEGLYKNKIDAINYCEDACKDYNIKMRKDGNILVWESEVFSYEIQEIILQGEKE